MATHDQFARLAGGEMLLIDGATGTELERRGVNVELPLWSARALVEAPEVLGEVHRAYLDAGSQAVTTCTFRTHERSLAKAGLGDAAERLTRLAVTVARKARDDVNPDALVLGSVAPLEECYRPELAPEVEVAEREHEQIIALLVDAGVDVILLETMNCLREALAAARVADRLAPGRWMITFCTRNDGPPGVLLSGEPLIDALPELDGALAVGVNCVSPVAATGQVRLLRQLLPQTTSVVAYANVGYDDEEGNWISTDAVAPPQYAVHAREWRDAGATIIGGCCGTTPETIEAIVDALG